MGATGTRGARRPQMRSYHVYDLISALLQDEAGKAWHRAGGRGTQHWLGRERGSCGGPRSVGTGARGCIIIMLCGSGMERGRRSHPRHNHKGTRARRGNTRLGSGQVRGTRAGQGVVHDTLHTMPRRTHLRGLQARYATGGCPPQSPPGPGTPSHIKSGTSEQDCTVIAPNIGPMGGWRWATGLKEDGIGRGTQDEPMHAAALRGIEERASHAENSCIRHLRPGGQRQCLCIYRNLEGSNPRGSTARLLGTCTL